MILNSNTFSIRFVGNFIWFHHILTSILLGQKALAMLLQMSEAARRLESELNCLMCFLGSSLRWFVAKKILQYHTDTIQHLFFSKWCFCFFLQILFSIFHSSQVNAGTHCAWERGEYRDDVMHPLWLLYGLLNNNLWVQIISSPPKPFLSVCNGTIDKQMDWRIPNPKNRLHEGFSFPWWKSISSDHLRFHCWFVSGCRQIGKLEAPENVKWGAPSAPNGAPSAPAFEAYDWVSFINMRA